MTYYDGIQGKDCLTWCYWFVPYFGDPRIMLGMSILCVILTILSCHAILTFTFGMANLVFWTLTCFQCPFPCRAYTGMCVSNEPPPCMDTLLVWLWPTLS